MAVAFDEMIPESGVISSCSTTVNTGETMFLAFDREFPVGLCTMHAPVDTEYGAELVAAATERYGTGIAPPPLTDPAGLPEEPEATTDLIVVAGGIGLAVVVLFGGLLLLARRRGSRPA